jgi:hypothetical protein
VLSYESLERELPEEQVGRLLVALDLAEGDGTGLVALLRAVWSGSGLSNCHRSVIARVPCCAVKRTSLARLPSASCAGSSSSTRRTRLVAPGGALGRHLIAVPGVMAENLVFSANGERG